LITGGTNPALRTFYYRLLRLISLSIHPLFVFDGPNKPPFKRNKRTGPNVASIPEFLAKQLLKQFGLPFHLAPGEAEAECALLQRAGIVDAVLSEDVDTLMFGSGLTFRNWTPEASKSKVPTHINLYDAKITKETSGMDREGMVLVALMSGGDYVPEGIPGCGPKTACEAARAGLGRKLCQIPRRDKDALRAWKDELAHELHTNESKFFNRKHGKLDIPDDFPDPEILGYYTHPVISSVEKVEKLRRELRWDQDIDFKELRAFTGDAFDWTRLGGAKKFIRNLAPALLVRELRMRAENFARASTHGSGIAQGEEETCVKSIHGKRNHISTDSVTEFRISFTPHELVPIDLEAEEPDEEIDQDISDEEGNLVPEAEAPGIPSKKRAPSNYEPTQTEKLWVFETYVRAGAPLVVKEWDDRAKNARILVETRNANREARHVEREKKKVKNGVVQMGALDRFTNATRPAAPSTVNKPSQLPSSSQLPRSSQHSSTIQRFAKVTKPGSSSVAQLNSSLSLSPGKQVHQWKGHGRLEVFRSLEPEILTSQGEIIDLLSSPQTSRPCLIEQPLPIVQLSSDAPGLLPPTVKKRRRSPLRRWQTDTAVLDMTGEDRRPETPIRSRKKSIPASPSSLPSPSQLLPAAKKARVPKTKPTSPQKLATPQRRKSKPATEVIVVSSPSPGRQANLYDYFTPRSRAAQRQQLETIADSPVATQLPFPYGGDSLDLTASPTRKPTRRSPRQLDSSKQSRLAPPLLPKIPKSGPPGPLTESSQSSFRIPPSMPVQMMKEKSHDKAPPAAQPVKKNVFRIRESLPGTFTIEEIDLSNDVGTKNVKIPLAKEKKGMRFRKSEVSILDLTGN
jgi:Holliday junction resolvase YEN1